MEAQTVAVGDNGLTVHYFRAGKGEPLLYLHHFLGLVGFEPALQKLAQRFDVIAPYAPGWGPAKDDLVKMGVGPLDLTLHQCDVLDAFAFDSAHVVGVGIGAWMAAELAAIAPTRVRKLVLVNPVGLWLQEAQGADPFAQHPAKPSEVLFSDPANREALLLKDRDLLSALIDETLNLRASAKFLWPIMETGIRRRLPRIKAPTLIATSERDAVVPAAHGTEWQRHIRGASLTQFKGGGHLVELEQPEAFATLVGAFLTGSRIAAVA